MADVDQALREAFTEVFTATPACAASRDAPHLP
jgi:hypothetical protein